MSEKIEVIQADRDAAAAYMKLICDHRWSWQAIQDGGCDNTSVVQAFAAHRTRNDAQVAALVEALPPMAKAVLNEISGELAFPAGIIAANVTAESGIETTERQALDIMRAFRTLGIAYFGSLYDDDSSHVKGRGYWVSSKGYRLRQALAAFGGQQ